MTEDWRDGFRKSFLDMILREGNDMDVSADYWWGWYQQPESRRVGEAIIAEGVNYDESSWDDSEWQEFMGTFYTGDNRVYGIDARVVSNQGRVYHWRWRGTIAEAIESVLADA